MPNDTFWRDMKTSPEEKLRQRVWDKISGGNRKRMYNIEDFQMGATLFNKESVTPSEAEPE